MLRSRKKWLRAEPSSKVRIRQGSFVIEGLELRELLSSTADILFKPAVQFSAQDASTTASSSTPINTTVTGYSPAQIRKAYGFDKLSNDGAGQTIAIIDAYNAPNIVNDLAVFDKQFNLPAPQSFQIVSQTGSTTKLPKTDAGWAGEIALDVEWAHAIAPAANILLVEASSASLDDLMTAVKYARSAQGVSAISMSWGGSEFFSWNSQGEFSGQIQYDPIFTTPSGHQGVTFVAAAGDSGSFSGVLWPSSSPNVVAVGGTTLALTSGGSYGAESTWSGTTGGFSVVEDEPTWQYSVQTSGGSTPDVSLNADPNSGFAVYDSLAYGGYAGWQEVGGTSAGAPIWAALIALANQNRVAAGEGTLDGPSQALPMLYSVYPTSTNTSTTTYENTFNDVIDPAPTGRYHWRWGWGNSGNESTAGYDTATGLGTPQAASIVDLLTGSSSSGSNGNSGSGSNGNGSSGSTNPAPAQLPSSPLQGAIVSSFPVSVMDGDEGTVRIKITNSANSKFNGPIEIDLYASTTGTATVSDTPLTSATLSNVSIRAGGSKIVKLKFNYASSLHGDYFITAAITATGANTAPATAVSSNKVAISPANVDLATAFASTLPINITPGVGGDLLVNVQNTGNIAARGPLELKLYASADGVIDSGDQLLVDLPAKQVNLKAGRSITFKVHFVAPLGLAAGSYKLIADAASATSPADSNPENDFAVATTI